MTVHLVSVGVSLTDSLRNPRDSLKGHGELIRPVLDHEPHMLLESRGIRTGEAASDWIAGALAGVASERACGSAAELTDLCAQLRPGLWPSDISAELDTFKLASGSGARVSGRDVAVLISSDTGAGLVAGLWNAVALTGGHLKRVSFLAEPDQLAGDVRGQVVLVRVPGLDAGDAAGFSKAMAGLGTLGRELCAMAGSDEPFRFYLSGGFKAAIPYLIGLAEGIRSLNPERKVDAFVLHETTKSAVIRLPLRRLVGEWVTDELEQFDRTGAGKPASPALLEGYAYEKDGRTWRLTPFGFGLRALFSRPRGHGG